MVFAFPTRYGKFGRDKISRQFRQNVFLVKRGGKSFACYRVGGMLNRKQGKPPFITSLFSKSYGLLEL